jgi:TonB-dependent starch-binding outer membrane protein SusC
MSRSRLLRSVVAGGAFLGLGACGGPDLPPAGPGPGEVDTGYGTRDAREVTGAVTSVSGDHYNEGAPLNLQELLRGRVAGLEFVKGPGGQLRMRIRGVQSLRLDQEPLIVVDGIQISSSHLSMALAGLTREDIRQVDVLKDISSTAIYGSRGAGGVILITTRR